MTSRDWRSTLSHWLVPKPAAQAAPPPKIEPGLYHYQRGRDGHYLRFHLRVDPDGQGLLLASAAEAVRLSAWGTVAAKMLLDRAPKPDILAKLSSPHGQAVVEEVERLLEEIGLPSSRYPIFNLADPLATEQHSQLMAPFQADVVLAKGAPLQEILRRLWDSGVPHVRFLMSSESETTAAVNAIEWAEDLGMIAGARATASWWSSDERVRRLSQVGMDYVVLPWLATAELHAKVHGAPDWDKLAESVHATRRGEMTPVLELPLLRPTVDVLESRLADVFAWNVANMEVFAVATPDKESSGAISPMTELTLSPNALRQVATWIEELADTHPLQIVWLPPQICGSETEALEVARHGPRAGGDVTIRVEANGDVIPPRGAARAAGNLLKESWPTIWEHEAFTRFRNRVESITRCDQCPGLAICASDCPADPRGWARKENK